VADGDDDGEFDGDAVRVVACVLDGDAVLDDDGVCVAVLDAAGVCVAAGVRVVAAVRDCVAAALCDCVTEEDAEAEEDDVGVKVGEGEPVDDFVVAAVLERVLVGVCVELREFVGERVAVLLAVAEVDGANVGTTKDCTIEPDKVCRPMGAPNALSRLSVAPFICAPSDAPLETGVVSGKRLKSTMREML